MNKTSISHTVMRRVHRIHVLRTIAAPSAGVLVFLFALWGIGREVWVAKVFENMPSVVNVPQVLSFVTNAFIHTDLMVQILSLLAVAALVWLASEMAHLLRPTHRFA